MLPCETWVTHVPLHEFLYASQMLCAEASCYGIQGLTMDLSMGPNFSITSASLSAFDTIAIIILIPFYDRILIPFLSRYNLQPSYLQRVGIGLVVRADC
jgi:dipeptide/tripeptide permease